MFGVITQRQWHTHSRSGVLPGLIQLDMLRICCAVTRCITTGRALQIHIDIGDFRSNYCKR